MPNLDHVRLLESKVERAVQMIKSLHTEKDSLKKEIEVKDKRISELEKLIVAFKDDQSKIEEGIINALNQLSAFEDASYARKNEVRPQAAETETPEPSQEPAPAAPPKKEQTAQETALKEEPVSDNLQKDLDDVLGQAAANKQMDIF